MNEPSDHTRHYWIRHKDGYLFCGICKKKRDAKMQDKSEE